MLGFGRTYTARDISNLTSGQISLKILNNWTARKQWLVPTLESQPGKPRFYNRENVLEVVIVWELGRAYMPRDYASGVIYYRTVDQFGDWESGHRFGGLPELQPGQKDWFWVCPIYYPNAQPVPTKAVKGVAGIADAMEHYPATATTILDISDVVRRVDRLA